MSCCTQLLAGVDTGPCNGSTNSGYVCTQLLDWLRQALGLGAEEKSDEEEGEEDEEKTDQELMEAAIKALQDREDLAAQRLRDRWVEKVEAGEGRGRLSVGGVGKSSEMNRLACPTALLCLPPDQQLGVRTMTRASHAIREGRRESGVL